MVAIRTVWPDLTDDERNELKQLWPIIKLKLQVEDHPTFAMARDLLSGKYATKNNVDYEAAITLMFIKARAAKEQYDADRQA